MTLLEELAAWASKLEYDDIPARVVRWAKSQVLSQFAAVRAGQAHPTGAALVAALGPPLQPDVVRSASVLAGLGCWLGYDDTAYAGHLSNSTVTVATAYASHLGLSGRALLTAIIAANECAARITAAATLGLFPGQSAAHTHLAGAVAARLHSEWATSRQWVDALALAFEMPPRTLGPGFTGADARALSTLVPVRTALDACDLASAGLAGAADIMEHRNGFLARFAIVALPEAVTAALGERWHTETLSFKLHPCGPGGEAVVDCALDLHRTLGPGLDVEAIDEVVVYASLYTVLTLHGCAAYIRGPGTPTGALVNWIPYLVATALLTGDLGPADLTPDGMRDPRRWALAERVRVVHDPDLTRASFTGTAPFGEALRQAGPRGAAFLREFGKLAGDSEGPAGPSGEWLVDLVGALGPPESTFAQARRTVGARVRLQLSDGRALERARPIPVGAVGPYARAFHPALVRRKFLAVGGSEATADGLLALEQASARQVADLVESALAPREAAVPRGETLC